MHYSYTHLNLANLCSYSSHGCKYKTIQTGEQFLQAKSSMVVGISGNSTGMGLFTLKEIQQGKWITSYAPLAPVRIGHNYDDSNYIIKTTRDGSEVEIDGKLCPLALGCMVQDGTFPFILALEKFPSLIKSLINYEWLPEMGRSGSGAQGTFWLELHIKGVNYLTNLVRQIKRVTCNMTSDYRHVLEISKEV